MRDWWVWWIRTFLWLMALFLAQRILFLLAAHDRLTTIGWSEILECNGRATFLDLSVAGYVVLLLLPFSAILLFRDSLLARRSIRALCWITLVLAVLVNVADIGLFEAWGSRIDRKAISYLAFPKEAAASIPPSRWTIALMAVVAELAIMGMALRWAARQRAFSEGPMATRGASILAIAALGVLAARGGWQDDPIKKSWAYFSKYPVLNIAAVNGVWNALEVFVEPVQVEQNPYVTMPSAETEARFVALHPKGSGRPDRITTMAKPNILLIMLESITADVIGPLGGEPDVMPRFAKACDQGILFTHFYSTGFRTEQGLCALISGFPSQPTTTIIRNFGKFERLPSLARTLDSAGYTSTYWYAGNIEFANTRSYLLAMGFDRIHDEHSFVAKRRTEWGAFDEELFDFHLRGAASEAQPFFHVLMTATNHEPFDAPVNEGSTGGPPQMYRNTARYTDRCLGDFLERAQHEPWYPNTLIIILADHGHYLPKGLTHYSAARHHIPLLVTGGALREDLRGTTNPAWSCHVDIPTTVLAQLGLPRSQFAWGHDLFDPSASHTAFWTYNNGFGIADSMQTVVYDEDSKRVIELRDSMNINDRNRLVLNGSTQLQVLLDRYIGFNQ